MSVPTTIRLVSPVDEDAHRRVARLRELGLWEKPDPEFDEFARSLAEDLNAPFGMVNLIGPGKQYVAGVYPSSEDRGVDPKEDPLRTFGCEYGFCMYVVTREHAMALDEVTDYHLFAGNPVIEAIGVRSYLGAPLMDESGPLGTICALDLKRHTWRMEDVEFIKARAAQLVARIRERAGLDEPALAEDAAERA